MKLFKFCHSRVTDFGMLDMSYYPQRCTHQEGLINILDFNLTYIKLTITPILFIIVNHMQTPNSAQLSQSSLCATCINRHGCYAGYQV